MHALRSFACPLIFLSHAYINVGSCVPSDPAAARAVATGPDGIVEGLSPGKGYVDVSTVDAATSSRIAAAVRLTGAAFLEAPVSGSKGPAEAGKLIFLTAGRSRWGDGSDGDSGSGNGGIGDETDWEGDRRVIWRCQGWGVPVVRSSSPHRVDLSHCCSNHSTGDQALFEAVAAPLSAMGKNSFFLVRASLGESFSRGDQKECQGGQALRTS